MRKFRSSERAIEIAESAINEGSDEIRREAISVDSGYADVDRFEARAKEAAALEEPVWLKTFNENGIDVLRFHDWDEKTQSGGWRIPSSEQIENGLIAESHDQYLRLKTAPPLGAFGTGAEGRAARAQYVNEHGIDAYLDRHVAAKIKQQKRTMTKMADKKTPTKTVPITVCPPGAGDQIDIARKWEDFERTTTAEIMDRQTGRKG